MTTPLAKAKDGTEAPSRHGGGAPWAATSKNSALRLSAEMVSPPSPARRSAPPSARTLSPRAVRADALTPTVEGSTAAARGAGSDADTARAMASAWVSAGGDANNAGASGGRAADASAGPAGGKGGPLASTAVDGHADADADGGGVDVARPGRRPADAGALSRRAAAASTSATKRSVTPTASNEANGLAVVEGRGGPPPGWPWAAACGGGCGGPRDEFIVESCGGGGWAASRHAACKHACGHGHAVTGSL